MNLWIVGRINPGIEDSWEFYGVYDNRELAIAACKSDLFFVGPAVLNETKPDERIEWPGGFYPLAKTEAA